MSGRSTRTALGVAVLAFVVVVVILGFVLDQGQSDRRERDAEIADLNDRLLSSEAATADLGAKLDAVVAQLQALDVEPVATNDGSHTTSVAPSSSTPPPVTTTTPAPPPVDTPGPCVLFLCLP